MMSTGDWRRCSGCGYWVSGQHVCHFTPLPKAYWDNTYTYTTTSEPFEDILLLREIRDLLKSILSRMEA